MRMASGNAGCAESGAMAIEPAHSECKSLRTAQRDFFRTGEYVNAGSPVLALMPVNSLKVRFFVPQSQLGQFKVGAMVDVFADGVGDGSRPVQAQLFHIARSAEFTPPVIYDKKSRQKLVFLLEARLPPLIHLKTGAAGGYCPAMSELAVDVHGLVKRFGSKVAVNGVDIQLPVGQVWRFLGPNGSGKTTTIRMICGLLNCDAGSGQCLGFDILREAEQIRRLDCHNTL